MSNIPEDVENDPRYRREMLYAWAVIAKERDELVEKLNKQLEDHDTLKSNKIAIDALLDEIQDKDIVLGSSRFSRVLHNVTTVDRIVVGIRSIFTIRSRAMLRELGQMTAAAALGLMFAALTSQKIEEVVKKIWGALTIDRAYAVTGSPPVAANLDPIQVYVIIGFSLLIAAGFLWFAVTATLSKEASTRKNAMEMTKSVMLFMMGLVTGYLSNRH